MEERRVTTVDPVLREIDAFRNREQLIRLAARFSHDGFPSFLTLGSAPDAHDSSVFTAVLGQGALGLPDRDLYLKDDERSTTLRREYQAHVQRMFEILAGSERTRPPRVGRVLLAPPERLARAVMDVETSIARATMD